MGSKYKKTGPINSVIRSRDFKRWVFVFNDGEEIIINRKRFAIIAARCQIKEGNDFHIFEETVIRNLGDKRRYEKSFRIEITDRIKYEIMLKN